MTVLKSPVNEELVAILQSLRNRGCTILPDGTISFPDGRHTTTAHVLTSFRNGLRRRSCFNADGAPKREYKSKADAKAAAMKYQRAYECPFHGWHIGSSRRANGN